MTLWSRLSGDGDRTTPRVAMVVLAVLAMLILAGLWIRPALRAGALLEDAVVPPAEIREEVVEETVMISPEVEARLYRPQGADGPLPAFVVVHGAIGQGAADPRMVDLSRALAVRGATVLAPELTSLAGFRIDADDPGRIGSAVKWLHDRPELTTGDVGLFGISIGGSYALVASADPDISDLVSAVMVFGGYHELGDLLQQWMTEPIDSPTVLDPVREGRRLVLLGNIDRVVEPDDVEPVRECLESLLDGQQCGPDMTVGLMGQLVMDAAQSESPLQPSVAGAFVDALAFEVKALSPAELAASAAHPVYLLHAVGDPIVPTADSERIAATLSDLGWDVHLHITTAFEHVDTDTSPSIVEAWPLLRFVARFLEDAGL